MIANAKLSAILESRIREAEPHVDVPLEHAISVLTTLAEAHPATVLAAVLARIENFDFPDHAHLPEGGGVEDEDADTGPADEESEPDHDSTPGIELPDGHFIDLFNHLNDLPVLHYPFDLL